MHATPHDATPPRPSKGRDSLADRPFQRMGPVKSVAGALAATGAFLPPAYAMRLMNGHPGRMPQRWHQAISRALGVRSQLLGRPATGSVLYVLNHLSWMDIPVVGAHLHAAFVAKAEVGSMGVVGFFADIQDTIYVERERRSRAAAQANEIQTRLQEGGNVILFPEGTSNDGVRILPFKSTLFSVVEGAGTEGFRIQPVTLAYTHLNGLPITRNRLIELAWIGDMELGAHAFDCMRLGRIDARIQCHEPVRRSDFADRKALARHCQTVISRGYQSLMRGHA
jgi:1-acyl-sn-glycerol-3-phosphate acyltransferase